jgi:hypothetical protein
MNPNVRGGGGRGGCGASANEHSCALGAQINFGDLTPYLTYGSHKSYNITILYCFKFHEKITEIVFI